MNNLIKQLKELKSVSADAEFVGRCRQNILETPNHNSTNQFYYRQVKQHFIDGFSFALAVGLTALLLYISYLSIGFINQNNKTQIAEVTPNPDFNISLEEARYFKEVAPDVYIVVLEDKK